MFKRAFTLTLGLGAGALVGAYLVRRVDAAKQAMAPTALAGQASRVVDEAAGRLRTLREDARREAARHEAELRERFDVPRLTDAMEP